MSVIYELEVRVTAVNHRIVRISNSYDIDFKKNLYHVGLI